METAPTVPDRDAEETSEITQDASAEEFIADELLVEEISIDGMCGVY